jgi:hypothetical protein
MEMKDDEKFDWFRSNSQEEKSTQEPSRPQYGAELESSGCEDCEYETDEPDHQWDNDFAEQNDLSNEFYTFQLITEQMDMEDYARYGIGSAEWDREYELLVMALTGKMDYSLPWIYPNN